MEERKEERQRPASPLFADNAELKKNKRTSGQKIIMFVMFIVVTVMIFVFMADNSERTVERERSSRNARLTDASRLTNDLLEASRRPPVLPQRPTETAEEEKPPEKKPQQVIIVQQTAPKKKTRKVTDEQKESRRKWRDLRANSLESKSSIESFSNLRSDAPQPAQNSASGSALAARGSGNLSASDLQAMAALESMKTPQQRKLDFLTQSDGRTPQDYSSNIRRPQLAPMELKAGTVIPGLLLTGINSDLPGMVIGQVSENVYDSATGNWLLIPQGSRLIGVYDSNIAQGQNRVAVVWNRIIYPDGSSLNIAGTPGADLAGYSGIKGKVDNHYGQLLMAALFTSFFTAAVDIASDRNNDNSNNNNNNNDRKSARDVLVETTATTIANIGSRLAERALDIQPTIIVKPGTRHNVIIQQDVIFPEPWREPTTKVSGF